MQKRGQAFGAPARQGLLAAAVILLAAGAAAGDVNFQPAGPAVCPICGSSHPLGGGEEPAAFQLVTRWSQTFTDGSGLVLGQPTTITWSIVPDGTNIPAAFPGNGEVTGPSNLIAQLDTAFSVPPGAGTDYTTRPWFFIFEDPFTRWSELAGLSYSYVSDDGVEMNNANIGTATRGDVRIGGHNISGPGSILAYNYYPNRGDMVIDTSDISFFSNSTNTHRAGRNIIAHEHGHGMGIAHLESNNGQFLMEPFLSTAFDGPQFDDILSAQRLYGDALEKNGGNDTAGTAWDFGPLSQGQNASIGFHAGTTTVSPAQSSFVSIDDESDVDFYEFTLTEEAGVWINLFPRGPTYNEGPQGGTQSAFYTYALSDLVLTLFDTDGTSVLSSADLRDLGGHERIFEVLASGTYFVQVGGLTANRIQMYELQVMAGAIPEPASVALLGLGAMILLGRRRAA